MIYTYSVDNPLASSSDVYVDSDRAFVLAEAQAVLNLSRQEPALTVAYTGTEWWTHKEVGKLWDFLGYHGADILHVVGEFAAPHSAYLSLRLEKLYDESTLDEWAQA